MTENDRIMHWIVDMVSFKMYVQLDNLGDMTRKYKENIWDIVSVSLHQFSIPLLVHNICDQLIFPQSPHFEYYGTLHTTEYVNNMQSH